MRYSYFSKREQIFHVNSKYTRIKGKINEDGSAEFPRFKLKKADIFPTLPLNKWVKVTEAKFKLAIENGMILEARYRTHLISKSAVKPRNIYPMVLGRSKRGDLLLRGYHLDGYSVSKGTTVDKEWRLFRVDRFVSIRFTGAFFRLPPANYVEMDSIMKGGIIISANFNKIRSNQESLISKGEISDTEQVITTSSAGVYTIQVEDLAEQVDTKDIFDNGFIKPEEATDTKITFLKSSIGNNYIALIGVIGEKSKLVKLFEGSKQMGVYRVLDAMYVSEVETNKNNIPNKKYDLFMYIGKKFK
jgi:hypothetical protein